AQGGRAPAPGSRAYSGWSPVCWRRMARALLPLLLVACSVRPLHLSGTPCPCPDGWSCDTVTNTCSRDAVPMLDGGDDAPDAGCTDGPDEDADGRPDACDVCPGDVDDGADSDGDGVGDACDPNPTE